MDLKDYNMWQTENRENTKMEKYRVTAEYM
jgi:hypothetical protein